MKNNENKQPLSRGVFWIIDGKLFAFPYSGGTILVVEQNQV